MRRLTVLICGLTILTFCFASAVGQEKKKEFKAPTPGPSFKHLDGQMIVLVADGVGGSTTVFDNLMWVNDDCELHLRIFPFSWCRKLGKYEDLEDLEAQYLAAHRMAGAVTAIRKDARNAHFFLVGHSAGARIVLAAAEQLPEKSLDRVIVMASAVPCYYDLRKALKASRFGIDHFFSAEDGVLDRAENRHGVPEGSIPPMAGRVGFRPPSHDKKDMEAYRMLRQYKWTAADVGNGGHFTWTNTHALKRCVVPLFFTAPPVHVMVEKKK